MNKMKQLYQKTNMLIIIKMFEIFYHYFATIRTFSKRRFRKQYKKAF